MRENAIGRAGRVAAVCAAIGHLVLVALGASHVRFDGARWPARAVACYCALTGADNAYGFFAPGVTPIPWARFEVTTPAGVRVDALETGINREADLRVRNVLGAFPEGSPALRRSLAASWAGKVLSRHPGAE